MTEQAEQLVADVGAKVLEYLEATEGFVVEQAPLLAQEIVRYGVLVHGLPCGLGMVMFLIGSPILIFTIRSKNRESDGFRTDENVALIVVSAISLVIGAIVFGVNIAGLIKPLAAPRLYIIEQIGRLM